MVNGLVARFCVIRGNVLPYPDIVNQRISRRVQSGATKVDIGSSDFMVVASAWGMLRRKGRDSVGFCMIVSRAHESQQELQMVLTHVRSSSRYLSRLDDIMLLSLRPDIWTCALLRRHERDGVSSIVQIF